MCEKGLVNETLRGCLHSHYRTTRNRNKKKKNFQKKEIFIQYLCKCFLTMTFTNGIWVIEVLLLPSNPFLFPLINPFISFLSFTFSPRSRPFCPFTHLSNISSRVIPRDNAQMTRKSSNCVSFYTSFSIKVSQKKRLWEITFFSSKTFSSVDSCFIQVPSLHSPSVTFDIYF